MASNRVMSLQSPPAESIEFVMGTGREGAVRNHMFLRMNNTLTERWSHELSRGGVTGGAMLGHEEEAAACAR